MKKLAIALIVLSLLLAGCAGSKSPVPPMPVPLTPAETAPMPETNGTPSPVILHKEPPEDMTWISPGKVNVSNFYAGARAEYEMLVHNGKDEATEFSVTYRIPNQVSKGYVKAPVGAQDWVIIADSTPVIKTRETKEILIVLDMPLETTAPPKWEFWISVMEKAQPGMIHTELCARWLVDMRE